MTLIEDLFNVIAPHECLGCAEEGSLLCYSCASLLATVPPRCYRCGRWSDNCLTCASCRKNTSIHSLSVVVKYEGVAKELVQRLKFERAKAAARTIAAMLALRCPADDDMVITYVPTANIRVRARGYDQAALIAKELSIRLERPFSPALARFGQQRQVGKSREIRTKQMHDAFRPIAQAKFQNKHVLLVDDVLTTGATCEAAARTLRRAGAKRVSAAVFAVA